MSVSSVGTRYSVPVQTGPWAYPASYTVSTGSFLGSKRPERGVDHPPLSSAEVKERVELFLYYSYGSSWPVLRVNFSFVFTLGASYFNRL
jgi:hypothetical protein